MRETTTIQSTSKSNHHPVGSWGCKMSIYIAVNQRSYLLLPLLLYPFHSIAQVLVHKYLLIGRPETWKAHLSRKRKTTSLGVSSQSRRWKMFNEYLISCWCSAIFSPISVFQSTEPIIWFVSVSKCIERREIPSRELIFQVHKKALIVSAVSVQWLPRITCRSGHELAIDR